MSKGTFARRLPYAAAFTLLPALAMPAATLADGGVGGIPALPVSVPALVPTDPVTVSASGGATAVATPTGTVVVTFQLHAREKACTAARRAKAPRSGCARTLSGSTVQTVDMDRDFTGDYFDPCPGGFSGDIVSTNIPGPPMTSDSTTDIYYKAVKQGDTSQLVPDDFLAHEIVHSTVNAAGLLTVAFDKGLPKCA